MTIDSMLGVFSEIDFEALDDEKLKSLTEWDALSNDLLNFADSLTVTGVLATKAGQAQVQSAIRP